MVEALTCNTARAFAVQYPATEARELNLCYYLNKSATHQIFFFYVVTFAYFNLNGLSCTMFSVLRMSFSFPFYRVLEFLKLKLLERDFISATGTQSGAT